MSGLAELAHAAQKARAARPGVPLALATLVEVEGSSYRQPGARMLVDADGRVLAGAISGGCLEADVAAQAEAVCASGHAITLRYDLRADLETIWGFGSACEGVAHIVLEPLGDGQWLSDAAEIRAARTGGALLTVAGDENALGTVALLRGRANHGEWSGTDTVSAPGVNPTVDMSRASRVADVAQKTAVSCCERAGSERYFIEPLMPVVSLYLVGAGRGAEAFARIATTLGWDVTVIDHRPALLEALAVPDGVRVVCARAEDGAALVTRDSRTAVAVLTHIFDVDAAWLTALLPLPIGYLGVLGSRQRAARLIDSLSVGVDGANTERPALYAPIGLDLGGEAPESIALAAVAEIEAVMHGRPGGFLRERGSPIHTRTPTPVPQH